MREQMKYYIAFAENSIEGHLESGPRRPHGDQEQIRELIAKLQNAQVRLTDQLYARSVCAEFRVLMKAFFLSVNCCQNKMCFLNDVVRLKYSPLNADVVKLLGT